MFPTGRQLSDSGFLTNAAASQLKPGELEATFQITDDLVGAANYAYHEAHFTQYVFFDDAAGAYVDVAGKQPPLSPHHLALAGILYIPKQGSTGPWSRPTWVDASSMRRTWRRSAAT